jgi:CysZ protein
MPAQSAAPQVGLLRELGSGVELLRRGGRLLRERRELWPLALLPVALTLAALAAAASILVGSGDEIAAWIGAALPVLEPGAWYSWLWIGPGKVLLFAARWLLFAVAALATLIGCLLVASLLGSPALDALSERVERCVTGPIPGDEPGGGVGRFAAEAASSVVNEARRLGFFAAVYALIWGLAFALPGGALLAPPLTLALTVLFLPLQYAGYSLDRRRIAFGERRRWLGRNRACMTGFGLAAFAVGVVPGLNLLLLPVLVTAGTLLVLERPPERDALSVETET